MNSIYPYPMDGDVVSYRNEEGEYVYGEVQKGVYKGEQTIWISGVWVGRGDNLIGTNNFPDLQWIKRKDGTPLVNVGDEVLHNGCWHNVMEVGVRSFMICSKGIYGEWVSYSWLSNHIKRKYPLPDEEAEDKKISIHFMESKGMEYIRNNNATLLCECGKEHEIVIKFKDGIDVEDLIIKKEE